MSLLTAAKFHDHVLKLKYGCSTETRDFGYLPLYFSQIS